MFRFITEDYLKDLYRKEPFKEFKLNENERLTPGGRQYLLDKGININSNLPTDSKKEEKRNEALIEEIKKDSYKIITYKCKAIEAAFLESASKIINEDLNLAQRLIDLGREIKNIREFAEGKIKLESNPKTCDIYNEEIEITDVYIYLKNSKQILNLYILLCKLNEFKYDLLEKYENDELVKDILINLENIINILSMTISKEIGG
ncbi:MULTISPECIES: hypothetical protein [Clostridium]|uniref:Ethanolamine utilization cobalamin adenosyltransferase n=1 Tax=Clostridium nitritogenes TaxID=83340 RepID=A0ABN1LFA2_9CLOT|nr:hypothetical protein [Clostridium baratii]AQM59096.1 hypothetical protein NPD11_2177 [Clostridium baratii]KJU72332.1 hypothetical protein UC77_06410 [Clostridium baratii]MBS6043061.1 cobalamin adenosyltransferase [Clostridium baratii]MBT9830733.1 cobalamin adenosyltransferase [Clostridium baratii]MDU1855240.1 cobalamin adenosyltransferase [Clostridium baratii]